MKGLLSFFFLIALLTSCNQQNSIVIKEQPLYPVDELLSRGGVVWVRAPFYVHDKQYPLVGYKADGEPEYQVYEVRTFPTDTYVVFSTAMDAPKVLLARSPHGGCILRWTEEENQFVDPCYGSIFDVSGKYISGPAQRDLDTLPSEVRDNLVWVRNEIQLGESHE